MSTQERISILKNALPSSWIAFSANEDRVVGFGETFAQAARAASEAGEDDPVMTFIPPNWGPALLSQLP
jgi:hypothetical protein